jgi:hypothetical protein
MVSTEDSGEQVKDNDEKNQIEKDQQVQPLPAS